MRAISNIRNNKNPGSFRPDFFMLMLIFSVVPLAEFSKAPAIFLRPK